MTEAGQDMGLEGTAGVTDGELARRALAGEAAAFERLVARHAGLVYTVALGRLGEREAAEDLAQEVFLRVWLNLAQYDPARPFAHWVARITHNLAINWRLSRQGRSALLPLVPLDVVHDRIADPGAPDPRQCLAAAETEEHVARAVLALPPDLRELVLLHYTAGLNQRQIAEHLGVNASTVCRQLEKAVKRMRKDLEKLLREAAPRATGLRPPQRMAERSVAVVAAAAALSAGERTALAQAAGNLSTLAGPAAFGSAGSAGGAALSGAGGGGLLGGAGQWLIAGRGLVALLAVLLAMLGGLVALFMNSHAEQVRVAEFWEDPLDPTHKANEDTDGDVYFDGSAVPRGLEHPALNLAGRPAFRIATSDRVSLETPLVSPSGFVWAGYCAARSVAAAAGNRHDLTILNPTALGIGSLGRQSFLDFTSHNVRAAADFPVPYDARTGSYVYTLFRSNPAAPPAVDGRPRGLLGAGGRLRTCWNYKDGRPTFRFLIQTGGKDWWRTAADLPMQNVAAFNGRAPWTDPRMTPRQKEACMQSFRLAGLPWEPIAAAVAVRLNGVEGGPSASLGDPPGALAREAAHPDLAHITGLGVVVTALADGVMPKGLPESIHLLGLELTGRPAGR